MDNTQDTLGNLIYKTPRSFHATGVTSAYVNAEIPMEKLHLQD